MLPYSFQRLVCAYASVPTLLTLRKEKIFAQAAEEALRSHNPLEIVLLHLHPQRISHAASIGTSPHITLAIVDAYKSTLAWELMSDNPALTPDIIKKYKDDLDWDNQEHESVSSNRALVGQGLHPLTSDEVFELIDYCQDKINWMAFSRYQRLTPALMERYCDKLKWKAISRYQTLTPALLEKYADRLDWTNICIFNKSATLETMKPFLDRLDWSVMGGNEYITPQFIIDNYHRFTNWDDLSYICLEKFPELIINYPEWPWRWD